MHEETIVTNRLICDYVETRGGVTKVPLTSELLTSVGPAQSRYRIFLDQERTRKESEIQSQKRKLAEDGLEQLKKEEDQFK